MRLQWLHVRAKPNHCREIRPPAHRPPWDDAGAEAQRRAVTSISHVVLVYYELKFVQVYGRRLGTTGWGERTAYFLCGVPGPLWRRPRYSPCTGRSARRW
jgi:hypothetical protein